MIEMDERVLVDSFVYEAFDSEDRNHNPKYKDGVIVDKVRIDRTNVYSSDSNQQKIVASAIIFYYVGLSTQSEPFKERSRVLFDGSYKTIEKVVKVTQPYSSDVFSYELEVL